MSTFRITTVDALEIVDSRGQPTLQVVVTLGDGSLPYGLAAAA